MPKVSRVSRVRTKALSLLSSSSYRNQSGEGDLDEDESPTNQDLLSRGQRKRLAKREQYLKREQMVMSSLKLKHAEDQKSRIDGLDAIKNALVETIKHGVTRTETKAGVLDEPEHTKTNNSKKNIARKEINQLNLVLQHPSFQTNPFATIQEHLKNTFAAQAEIQERNAVIERTEQAKRAEQKKVERKERIRDSKFEKTRRRRQR